MFSKRGNWSESARRVLKERYLLQKDGVVAETEEGMCRRVAVAIAAAEGRYEKGEEEVERLAGQFYDIMVESKFLPNSPTLMNAGKENGLQYSACFVLPVGDSMEEIFDSVKNAAIIHKSGGGTGFAFSRLRSKDSIVTTTGGKASGPVSFLRVFNAATEAVKQGGTRRGANMGILKVDHPDILEFIECKLDGGITNFNISVAITDEFMRALESDGEYELREPHNGELRGRLRARDVFERIVRAAWATGDPGLVFIDRINKSPSNPVPALETIEATNPCGEQPLAPNDACNLGSINLAAFAKRDDSGECFDRAELERVVRLAVRFLDNVIEMNPFPLDAIKAEVHANRRIGLGVMGWADLLLELGIPYDSDEALQLADEVMAFIKRVGHDESRLLAEERGPFPNWEHSIYKDKYLLRNSTVTTIAPTGTISIISGCSSGIEPLFAIAYSHIVGQRHLTFVNPVFERIAKEQGFYSEELMEKVAKTGTVHGLSEIPAEVRRIFVTAHEVPYPWHVRHQGAFQKHTDNGVSKTINLANEATTDDVARAYMMAWEQGCLGITVFRDGSKTGVLHVGTDKPAVTASGFETKAPVAATPAPANGHGPGGYDVGHGQIKHRPRIVEGVTYRASTPLGTAFITVNRNGGNQPLEVFVNVGKAGSDTAAVSEAIGRLISLSLRLPSPMTQTERVREIVGQLSGIGGGRQLGFGRQRVRSLPDGIAQVLGEHIGLMDEEAVATAIPTELPYAVATESHALGDLCPDCGHATLVAEEGCAKCYSCGFTEC
ncbi:MAG: vitamin B12-dependent ribonucleotide reductase [Chloroflexi bacterium]|nr:vitamin B12-dependent ribonucleotide reductase [Chloroflexota bacterium]